MFGNNASDKEQGLTLKIALGLGQVNVSCVGGTLDPCEAGQESLCPCSALELHHFIILLLLLSWTPYPAVFQRTRVLLFRKCALSLGKVG